MNRNIVLIIAWIGLGCFVMLGTPGDALAELHVLSQTDVFVNGTYNGHACDYRIPSIVTAPDGTLIAFIEEGRDGVGGGDPGDGNTDLVYKRSFNNGVDWTAKAVLDDPGGSGSNMAGSNPTPVVDRDTGKVWVFYNRWEAWHGIYQSQAGTDDCQAWARHSDDNGATWSDPIDLTHQARDYDNWSGMSFGPGGAIQAANGRLIVPAERTESGSNCQMSAYAFYSDDHGTTWHRGEVLGGGGVYCDECQMVELADGNIMISSRQWPTLSHRWKAISTDGGQTWGEPVVGETVTAVAIAMERYTFEADGDDCNRIIWTGPGGPLRHNLDVRVSFDEGETFPEVERLYDGSAGYSDLTILADGTIGVIFERDNYARMTFMRFSVVPEPSTLVLLAIGLIGLLCYAWRKRK